MRKSILLKYLKKTSELNEDSDIIDEPFLMKIMQMPEKVLVSLISNILNSNEEIKNTIYYKIYKEETSLDDLA